MQIMVSTIRPNEKTQLPAERQRVEGHCNVTEVNEPKAPRTCGSTCMLDLQGDGVMLTAALPHNERSELGGNAAADTSGAGAVGRCQLVATDAVLRPDRRARAAVVRGTRPNSHSTRPSTKLRARWHSQERDFAMHSSASPEVFVGIDVAKDKFDVHLWPEKKAFTCDNTTAGIDALETQHATRPGTPRPVDQRTVRRTPQASASSSRRVAGDDCTPAAIHPTRSALRARSGTALGSRVHPAACR